MFAYKYMHMFTCTIHHTVAELDFLAYLWGPGRGTTSCTGGSLFACGHSTQSEHSKQWVKLHHQSKPLNTVGDGLKKNSQSDILKLLYYICFHRS